MSNFNIIWCDADTEFNADTMNVSDENLFSFTMSQEEGEYAQIKATIKNPRIGLLNAGRKLWAWFTYVHGGVTYPMLKGRLVGVPSNIFAQQLELVFVARPADYTEQKETVAATMRELPHFDPVFIAEDKRTDPDAVLEARSENWHIDPITHVVSTSDVIEGEDGEVAFAASEILFDSLSCDLGAVPITRVKMKASFSWNQRHYDIVNLYGGSGLITGFNSIYDFADQWPKPGDNIGDGWSVFGAYIIKGNEAVIKEYQFSYSIQPPPMDQIEIEWHGVTSYSINKSGPIPEPVDLPNVHYEYVKMDRATDPDTGNTTSNSLQSTLKTKWAWNNAYQAFLSVAVNPERTINEMIEFELTADMQAVVTLPEEDDLQELEYNSTSLSEAIPPNDAIAADIVNAAFPIVDTRNRSYIDTARGRQSLEYLLLIARARIRANSRAIRISFNIHDLTKWLDVSLRKTASIADPRLPGGVAAGKITAYNFALDGNNGRFDRKITIQCAVGNGGAWEPVTGEPTYCSTDYTGEDYQQFAGSSSVVANDLDDIRYTIPTLTPNDDGIDLRRRDYLARIIKILPNNDAEISAITAITSKYSAMPVLSEEDIGAKLAAFTAEVKDTLETDETRAKFKYTFPVINGEFTSTYTIAADPVKIPKQIDLAAESNA